MRRFIFLIPLLVLPLILLAVVLAGRGSLSGSDSEEAIARSVEATLTAIAGAAPAQVAETPAIATPTAAPAASAPTGQPDPTGPAAPAITLPPEVADFNPRPRPASSKGDPEAPVVIYEWSDYT
ncbi:MAG: hypothetical protein D6775_13365 [Caldilineae bacterium]|nr:MAG: hypothetical protein D6775_13365 [Caldilineae bacterium]